ncbi:MAG: hypothetical protein K9H61_07535 [Bacteroidia bacterium]|nr:hypothetical protein [Bacteroidia bacterium]MCF8425653.1 hypothetical protein [Bacteroidia bacterium]MCF8446832.1 hypothetical protein [Bacteroidia bacterium]
MIFSTKKHWFFVPLLLLFFVNVHAQDFLTKNFSPKEFNAHPYMWDATQDASGRLYFANNNGVLRFDGQNWFTFQTPSPVRHLVFGPNGDLFVACLGDFGVIQFNEDGNYTYLSLKKQLPFDKQKTGGNESVLLLGKSIYFHMNNRLVLVKTEERKYETTIYDLEPMYGVFAFKGKLYLNTESLGLGVFERGKIKIIAGGELLAGKTISDQTAIDDKMVLVEPNGNAYQLKNSVLRSIGNLGSNGIISLNHLHNGNLVAGTMNKGVKMLDPNTFKTQSLQLPSDEIYLVFTDKEGNVWTSHSRGLTQTLTAVPIRELSKFNLTGNVTDLCFWDGQLYISTTAGVYKTDLQLGSAQKISDINSECWDLYLNNNKELLVASTDGLYSYSNSRSTLSLSGETILHFQKGNVSGALYVMGETATWKYNASNELELVKDIPGLANSVYENAKGIQFVGTYHEGLKLISEKLDSSINPILEGEIVLRMFKGNVYAQARDKVYLWEETEKKFKLDELGSKLFSNAKNKELVFENDFVIYTPNGFRIYEKNEFVPSSSLYSLSGKTNAIVAENTKYLMASEDRVYLINTKEEIRFEPKINFNLMEFGSNQLGFAGYYIDKLGLPGEEQTYIPEISNEDLPVQIWFSLNSLFGSDQHYFSYKIDGLNKNWSSWQNHSKLDLEGLSGGNYTLHVKGKDAYGNESKEAVFKFYIRAPWYLSGWAYLIYLLIGFVFIYLFVFINQKRLLTKNRILEEKVSERTKELYDEKEKSDELLLNILPLEVAEELKNTGSLEAKQFDDVTVLFTDFVGFTSISEKLTPKELVEEIHHCFKAFDEIIGKNKLEKIKTIGDAYMAVCGMPILDSDHAERVVNAAKEIHQFIAEYQKERRLSEKPYFEIRMGINSGPVIAGIVGVKKYAYDIWGDTVNTAARMEQNCEPGKINISGSTHELVKNKVTCSYRGKIEAKNKGRIDMYYITI